MLRSIYIIVQKIVKNRGTFPFIAVLSYSFLFYLSLQSITSGSLPFWYDPARDLLLALDNLKKFTLIGQPTGIPGIFYGPYWIWLLSVGLLFSHDPRFITIIILLFPYFFMFTFILFFFTRIFTRFTILILWVLFFLSFGRYATYLWNPHLAPLLFLTLICLLIFMELDGKKEKSIIKIFFAGFINGLIINFHISFGISIFAASSIFICLFPVTSTREIVTESKRHFIKRLTSISVFISGNIMSFLPYLIFEGRHGFIQTISVMNTFRSAMYNSAVVGQIGLKKTEIVLSFINIPNNLLFISNYILYRLLPVIILYFVIKVIQKKITLNRYETRLIIYLLLSSGCILFLYMISKNPVWQYHFIGVEIVILLFFGILINHISILKYLLALWVSFLMLSAFIDSISPNQISLYTLPTFASKKRIVEKIFIDAGYDPFALYVYSPAIYTYDYDYLFNWLGSEKFKKLPIKSLENARFIYLIIPPTTSGILNDFIQYRTPDTLYRTMNKWIYEEGTTVIKRERNT